MNRTWDEKAKCEKNDEMAMLSQVAHMYYDLGMLQPEIAKALFFSRSKVSRILKKAQDVGIVEIKVKRYLSRMTSYERKLEETFGLQTAIVLNNYGDDRENSDEALVNYAAMYISDRLKGERILGITGSHLVTKTVHKLKKVHDCNLKVVQTIGATINHDISGDLVNYIVQTYDGKAYFLNTPVYVDDLYAKEVLLRDPAVTETFSLFRRCDLLLMGIGRFDLRGDMPLWFGYMTERHRQEMASKGAVGSVCAMFYDINGQLLDCEWNKKCITMPWHDVANTRQRIAIARGQGKVKSILGALRGHLTDVLVTDMTTATAVLELQNKLSAEK